MGLIPPWCQATYLARMDITPQLRASLLRVESLVLMPGQTRGSPAGVSARDPRPHDGIELRSPPPAYAFAGATNLGINMRPVRDVPEQARTLYCTLLSEQAAGLLLFLQAVTFLERRCVQSGIICSGEGARAEN